MFVPQTSRIRKLANYYPRIPADLDRILGSSKNGLYIDYANVRNWSNDLGWNTDVKRLRQLFMSFTATQIHRFYYGRIEGDDASSDFLRDVEAYGYILRTKPVKRIKIRIDVSHLPAESLIVLRKFIPESFLKRLPQGLIKDLNAHLSSLNAAGTLYFYDHKCNFDVEIGTDMHLDHRDGTEGYLLWSCDGDFADALEQLLDAGRKVTVFGTKGKIARELNNLIPKGLQVYEVDRLKEFICYPKEMICRF